MALPTGLPAIATTVLKSEKVSEIILQAFGSGSSKKISFGNPPVESGGILGFLGGLFGGLVKNITGFVLWAVGALARVFQFSLTTLVGVVQGAFAMVWNFNFAATDQQLDQQLQQQYTALAGIVGGTLGNAAGYLICGGLANATLFALNPELGVYIFRELGEEGLEEFCGNAIALAYQSSYTLFSSVFTKLYQSNRALFTAVRNGLGSVLAALVPGNLGFQQYVKQRQGTGGVVSFADFVETSLDTIKNPTTREFFEEFLDEFGDGCWESLYVVAGGIERFMAERRTMRDAVLGPEKVVEVTLNREIESEKLIIAGREEELKPALVQTLGHYELVENRDVGQIVGEPVQEYIQANSFKGIRVNLMLFPYEEPPFYRGEKIKPESVRLWVPDVERSKLDWEQLKQACGGTNGYMWGRFRASARLDNGRSFVVLGASEQEVESQIERMLTLTSANLLTLNVSEQQKKGEVAARPKLQKEPRRVYPGFAYIVNRQEFLDPNKSITTVRGNFRDKKARIPLYTRTKPANFEKIIQELLTYGQGIAT
jgi:hypothetical protein